jgi:hypothetical protein
MRPATSRVTPRPVPWLIVTMNAWPCAVGSVVKRVWWDWPRVPRRGIGALTVPGLRQCKGLAEQVKVQPPHGVLV